MAIVIKITGIIAARQIVTTLMVVAPGDELPHDTENTMLIPVVS